MSKDNSSAAALLPSVREARMRAGLTQERLAELAGVSRRSVIRWEAGHVVPHRSELSFLLDALSIDGDERKDWLRAYAAGKKPDEAETTGLGKRLRVLRERSGISIGEL
ncbi:MAG TPA: helix-turn-helix transcriptional regulator, partial [Fimbriimonas sp.]|nr:helix-turn-helix transcriptional regulator [Fimbriimonas sp.]